MAELCCPKCGGTEFAATPKNVRGWRFAATFFHCDSCGAVLGGTFFETPAMRDALMEGALPPRTKKPKT